MLSSLVVGGVFFVKLNLKYAYFTVAIHPERTRYLKFQWRGKIYMLACLPFGLSSTSWAYTKRFKNRANWSAEKAIDRKKRQKIAARKNTEESDTKRKERLNKEAKRKKENRKTKNLIEEAQAVHAMEKEATKRKGGSRKQGRGLQEFFCSSSIK